MGKHTDLFWRTTEFVRIFFFLEIFLRLFGTGKRSDEMPARTRSVAAAESDEVVDSNVNNNKACKRRKSRSRSRGQKCGSRSRSRRSKSKGKKCGSRSRSRRSKSKGKKRGSRSRSRRSKSRGKKSRSKSRGKSTTRVKAHCVKAHKVRSHRVKSHTRKLSKSPKRCGKK